MAQFCAQCGASLEAEARFCAECGHLVGAAPTGGESGPSEVPTPEPAPKAVAVAGAGGAGAGGAGSRGGGVAPSGGGGGGVGRRVLIGFLVLALVAGGVVAGVALSGGDEAGANEITLESAGSEGRDPFTSSTVTDPPPGSTSPTVPPPPPPLDTTAQGTELSGGSAGLYGGSLNQGACDVEKQIAFLEQNPAKARAFAGVLGISAGEIPAYLRGLTPMILRYDTRVTNHGFFNGRATPRQSVLQAGTAVLVDRFGVPRVKCGCGNPLTPPLDLADKVTYFGERWDGFSLRDTVIIIENNIDIDIFVLVDFDLSEYYRRFRGNDGTNDTLGDGTGGGSTTTTTTTTQARCTATEVVPNGPGETVLFRYFRAIDAHDYSQAFRLLDANLQAGWASAGPTADGGTNFASFMAEHVRCVKVTNINIEEVSGEVGENQVSASLGIQWYKVELDARYLSPFLGGNGGFPTFYKVRVDPHTGAGRPPDQILEIATGL